MFIPDTHELAWAAGFFDGEGSIFVIGKTHLGVRLAVGQTDVRPLHRFDEAVNSLGTLNKPIPKTNPKHNPLWIYQVQKFEYVQAIIALLWKYLSEPKREQARLALLTLQAIYRA